VNLIQTQISNEFELFSNSSNFDRSKKVSFQALNFFRKYCCEGLEERNNILHRNFFTFKIDFELKIWESKSIFNFRKLIKIAKKGFKI
jgi:hypothetical protein